MRKDEFISFVYHGSDVPGLRSLTPRPSKLSRVPVVFAATLPEVAIAMTGHWTDNDFEFGRIVTNGVEGPYVMKELIPGSFEKYFSNPVYLYILSGNGFVSTPELQDFEVVSDIEKPVLKTFIIEDPLFFIQSSKNVLVQ